MRSGRFVTPASVTSGVPIAPKATGEVLAIRQMAAAWKGENPSPLNIAAATATGVPKPEAPSMNAPKAKAISSACSRRSWVRWPTEFLMISNWPVSTVSRYSASAQNTIQAMGNRPKAAP